MSAVGRAVFIVLLLAPLGVLAVVALRSDDEAPAAIRAATAPVVSEAQPRTIADEKRIAGAPTTIDGRGLRLGVSRGTVTGVLVVPGSVLVTGSPVAWVDGITRIAAHEDFLFYRKPESGDVGLDVASLHILLNKLGFLKDRDVTTPEGRYTFATSQAVRALEASLGVAPTTGVFDPALVVWLPAEPFEVGVVNLELGAQAPATGTVALSEAPRLAKVLLSSSNQGEPLALDPAVEWVLVIGKERFAIDPVKLEVAEADLARLQKLLKPKQERIDGLVQRATPLNVLAVPSTAIQVGRGGALCAWLPDGTTYRAVTVTTAGARAGVTNVVTGLAAGSRVLANPADVLEAPACPSP